MLTITARQLQQFDRIQAERFTATLCDSIRSDYPRYARLSGLILHVLVTHALMRAQSYGLSWQASQAQFVRLMAAVAPNFDAHPAIHAVLSNEAVLANQRIEQLLDILPAGVWTEAAAGASNLGWYLNDAGQAAAAIESRIAAALAHALPKELRHFDAQSVERACRRAPAMGLDGEDGNFAFVACSLIYGEGFEVRLPWCADIFAAQVSPPLRIELLKARAAIDIGVWL